jgi:phosphatidylglycerophosphate synthase
MFVKMVKKAQQGYVPIQDYKTFRKEYDYGDPIYSIYYKFFKRPISYPLTWLIYRYTNLRPNTITYLGFMFAIISAIFFIRGDYTSVVIGGVLFFVFELFDDFDGIIARSKNIRSRRGGWLDILAGYIGKFIILASLAIGAFNSTGDSLYLTLGLAIIVGFASLAEIDHVTKIRFSVVQQKKLKFVEHKPSPKTIGGMLSIVSEIVANIWEYMLLIACFTNQIPLFLIITAIYYPVYAAVQFVYRNHKHRFD